MKSFVKPLAFAALLASSLFLASCGDKKAEDTAQQAPAAQEQQQYDDAFYARKSYEDTPSHMGWPEGTELAEVQEVFLNNGSDPETLDPSFAHWSDSFDMIRVMFDTLVRQSRDGTYLPSAAESWETSADGLTWTFHLRKEAKWHDGVPVTAKDFVYSWQRLVDPKNATPYADYPVLMNVKNAQEVVAGNAPVTDLGVRAVDDYTFEISLSQPTPWLAQMLTLGVTAPLRQDVIEKYGDDWTRAGNLVGNGPFKLASYTFKELLVMEKDPEYWNAANVALNKIKVEFIADSNSTYLGYLSGKYNTVGLRAQQVEAAKKERPEELYTYSRPSIFYYTFNPERVPDVRARKAFALLFDREKLYRQVIKRHIPAYKYIPNGVFEGDKVREYDWVNLSQEERNELGLKLLAEAGYSQEHPLKLELPISIGGDEAMNIAFTNILKENSQGIIQIETKRLEGKAYYDFLKSRNYDLSSSGWNPDYDHVSTFTSIFTCDNANNRLKYCNPKYDELLAQAARETDSEKRKELYADAVDILQNDYVMVNDLYLQGFVLKSPALGGYNKDANGRSFADYYLIAGKSIKK